MPGKCGFSLKIRQIKGQMWKEVRGTNLPGKKWKKDCFMGQILI